MDRTTDGRTDDESNNPPPPCIKRGRGYDEVHHLVWEDACSHVSSYALYNYTVSMLIHWRQQQLEDTELQSITSKLLFGDSSEAAMTKKNEDGCANVVIAQLSKDNQRKRNDRDVFVAKVILSLYIFCAYLRHNICCMYCIVSMGFLPWEIQVAFLRESQL